ncbi:MULTISPECIES: hypothetical protein [unclassified Exiguobacterium]|uniref:hypothetical protein n=1 Tax=unclassified Exiguobacterium TaxID=2644629 RepID=UPI001BE60CBE|nr:MULTISPECIES: hypothetical protein [unclassified Exiguobacterium]
MRKLIVFHKNTYKPQKIKRNFKTKEFAISVILMVIFMGSTFFLFNLSGVVDNITSFILFVLAILSGSSMFLYIDHLEKNTEYFLYDNKDYQRQLERKLKKDFKITNVPQLEIAIKSITEERDKSIKKFGVTIPYVAIGITLIALFANKSSTSIEELIIYFVIYFSCIFLIHFMLKFSELFFNMYSDNLLNLINTLKQIQLDWLSDHKKEFPSWGG